MAAIHTKNPYRMHALRGHAWACDFSYDERMLTGDGSASKLVCESTLCLADEVGHTTAGGGVWTSGAAMGLALVR